VALIGKPGGKRHVSQSVGRLEQDLLRGADSFVKSDRSGATPVEALKA
jgi:hypothetical protein